MIDESKRGTIIHRERARQIINFSGLRYGKITPTDIDGLIDFGDRVFIIIEIKYLDAQPPHGQELAIDRVVDNLEKSGKKALGIIASHSVENTDGDIDAATCQVKRIRFDGKWARASGSVKDMIDRFLRKYAPEYLDA